MQKNNIGWIASVALCAASAIVEGIAGWAAVHSRSVSILRSTLISSLSEAIPDDQVNPTFAAKSNVAPTVYSFDKAFGRSDHPRTSGAKRSALMQRISNLKSDPTQTLVEKFLNSRYRLVAVASTC